MTDLTPFMRYADAPAAIDFLERAFGFTRTAVHEGEGGLIEHAELSWGDGMVMLGSKRESGLTTLSPEDVGGVTGGVYAVVEDPDAHFARAKEAGAEIVSEVTDQDYGSRDYTARDPEGFLWSFGTYRPGASTD